uniref:Neurotransmitter-gated ion-channel transmembrane domain-containing protein n=1 Tax=Parascaris univalens TaxID=6257 RepID=A0A914ZZ33_PARUN
MSSILPYQKEFGKYDEHHEKAMIYDSCATVEQIPLAGVHSKLCNGSPGASAIKRVSFTTDANGSAHSAGSSDTFESEFLRVLNRVHATIARNEMRLAENDRRDASNLEWQQVALVLDRFLLIVFVFGTAFVSLAIIYQRQLCLG